MPQLTVADAPVASTRSILLRSGREVTIKPLNGWELMQIDDFAIEADGQIRAMRMPYLRALASIQAINGAPFGPIRSQIDVQRWAQTLTADEFSELLEKTTLSQTSESVEQLKNGSTDPSDDSPQL